VLGANASAENGRFELLMIYTIVCQNDSLTNLPASALRERFERELNRLRGFRFKRLLIIGSEREIRQGVVPFADKSGIGNRDTQCIRAALRHPLFSARQLAWRLTRSRRLGALVRAGNGGGSQQYI
jgi:hypothetical protein